MHHLRNLTDENPSSSNGSGGSCDDDPSAAASRPHDASSSSSSSSAAAPTSKVSAADAASAVSCVAALGERQRQCRLIVKTLTEQHQQLLQAIDEEVSRARAQAAEAASDWTAAHGETMRLAQQQLQASASLARLPLHPCRVSCSRPSPPPLTSSRPSPPPAGHRVRSRVAVSFLVGYGSCG